MTASQKTYMMVSDGHKYALTSSHRKSNGQVDDYIVLFPMPRHYSFSTAFAVQPFNLTLRQLKVHQFPILWTSPVI